MSEGTLRVPAYLDHILLAIRRIGRYTKAMTQEEFFANEMAQDAVIRNIEILGEAAEFDTFLFSERIEFVDEPSAVLHSVLIFGSISAPI